MELKVLILRRIRGRRRCGLILNGIESFRNYPHDLFLRDVELILNGIESKFLMYLFQRKGFR